MTDRLGPPVTDAQLSALKWLRNRNGDGVFDRNQVLVAGGERAGVMRGTWTKLEEHEMVERYMDNRRVRVTSYGYAVDLSDVPESDTAYTEAEYRSTLEWSGD